MLFHAIQYNCFILLFCIESILY